MSNEGSGAGPPGWTGSPGGPSLVERVRSIVTEELPGGNPTAEHVARRLHMSKRTLHRRLVDHGLSFKVVMDDVRRGLARRHLEQGELQLTEIARAVGFNDLSAFRKAFRRWEGVTLGEYRRGTAAGSDDVED
ncbi:MAG: helix-turn-helix transcriptional regulator [Myxococcales bacterium]|nr:helix-turn-helix transcriptional regulator [Myxococcales bacterium]